MQKIHFKAPNCWINDPNGFIYLFQGRISPVLSAFSLCADMGQNALGTRCKQGSDALGAQGYRTLSLKAR